MEDTVTGDEVLETFEVYGVMTSVPPAWTWIFTEVTFPIARGATALELCRVLAALTHEATRGIERLILPVAEPFLSPCTLEGVLHERQRQIAATIATQRPALAMRRRAACSRQSKVCVSFFIVNLTEH
jgi:hypothetical protein